MPIYADTDKESVHKKNLLFADMSTNKGRGVTSCPQTTVKD